MSNYTHGFMSTHTDSWLHTCIHRVPTCTTAYMQATKRYHIHSSMNTTHNYQILQFNTYSIVNLTNLCNNYSILTKYIIMTPPLRFESCLGQKNFLCGEVASGLWKVGCSTQVPLTALRVAKMGLPSPLQLACCIKPYNVLENKIKPNKNKTNIVTILCINFVELFSFKNKLMRHPP